MNPFIIISLLFLSFGFSQKSYDINHIVEQNNIYLKRFSDEIVNGEVFKMFGDMKVPLGNMKDGKKDGKWMVWYDNGTKKEQHYYKDGKKNGLTIEWRENGTKKTETQYLNDEKFGLETNYREEGGLFSQTDWIDRFNWRVTYFYKDGTISSSGNVRNKLPYEGQFYGRKQIQGTLSKSMWDMRKTIQTYEKGELIKVEWYERLDMESKVVVRVDDCVNTDDCLSREEKKQKNTTSTEKKIIYEKKPFRLSYILHNYGDDIEVEIIINNMGVPSYSSVWFNFSFFNKGEMVNNERISFHGLGVFGEIIEIIDVDDEFDEIKVEFLKSKLK